MAMKWKQLDKKRKIGILLSVAVVISLFVLIAIVIGKPLIQLGSNPEQFRIWVEQYGILGRLFMIGIVSLQIIIAMIPGEVFEVAAGYTFGFWEGTLLCLIGSMIGSYIVLLFVKKLGIRFVELFYDPKELNKYKFIQQPKKLHMIVFISFLIPGTPKDILTYLIGLTEMKISTFLILSTIARIPSVVTSTFSGNALGEEQTIIAIVAIVFTAIISLAGVCYYHKKINQQ